MPPQGRAWLAFRLVFRSTAKQGRKSPAGATMLPISLMATLGTLFFFIC